MYFYKLTQNGKTVFVTPSDEPILNPDYEEITKEEYEAFTGAPLPGTTLEELKAAKLSELSEACNAAITAGCDVALADGATGHISLTAEDQINLSTATQAVGQGAAGYPYHLDGQLCTMYPAADILAMAQAATVHKLCHTTYYNHLAAWVRRCETAEEVSAITYGAALPEDLAVHMAGVLAAAGGDTDAV